MKGKSNNILKIAVFVEGQGELIFIRNLIYQVYSNKQFSFECIELHAENEAPVPYEFQNENAEVHFKIINVGNDAKVLSAIKEREESLFNKGYSKIIGLRDMYSRLYKTKSSKISEELNQEFIQLHNEIVNEMSSPSKISFHFSIMEIESWWLSMYTILTKIEPKLTLTLINEKLNIQLDKINPEKEFFHPTKTLNEIFKLINKKYDKKFSQVESITNNILLDDIIVGIMDNRCESLLSFLKSTFELFDFDEIVV